jgi:hypothetical protein
MLSGQLGYSFSGFPIAVATVGYDYLSGTPLDDSRYRTFEAPYQSSHEQYGLMDYFKASPENTLGRGLQDAYLKLTCKPAEHLSITAWGHAFWLAQSLIGLWSLGEEADIVAAFEYDGHVTLELGAAGFLPEDLMRIQFNGSDVAWWGYSTVRVRF